MTDKVIKMYVCDSCRNTYEEGWSKEESNKESMELHGITSESPNTAIVCDDCFKAMRAQGLF